MHTAYVRKVHMLTQKGPQNGREFLAPEKQEYLKDELLLLSPKQETV